MALAGFIAYSHCKLTQRKLATLKQIENSDGESNHANLKAYPEDIKGHALNLERATRSRSGRMAALPVSSFASGYSKVPVDVDEESGHSVKGGV